MTREGANNLLANLRTYYPRSFLFRTDADVTAKVTDYEQSLSKWDDETGLKAAYNWHLEHSEAPTVADLIRECKLVDMEKQPYSPPPGPSKTEEYIPVNPWQKALDRYKLDHAKNPDDPHNFLYYVLVCYGHEEYLRVQALTINCKNRRNEENRRLRIDEVDDRDTEATFASRQEREDIFRLIREKII